MPQKNHYSPAINRFLVKAIYHEARGRGIAMTTLTNQLLQERLEGGEGWVKAQQDTMQMAEKATEYTTK